MSKYILLTIDPNLLSYKALSGNMICEIKACLSIGGVFKLFQIVVLANFHYKYSQKLKKKLLHFIFFVLKKMAWHDVCYDPLYFIFQYYGIHEK